MEIHGTRAIHLVFVPSRDRGSSSPGLVRPFCPLVTLLAYAGFYKVAKRSSEEALVPSNRLNLRTVIELLTEFFLKFIDDIMGHHGRQFLPLIGTLGFFILFSNLLGLVPGFLPPTDNLNTTVACALIVFFTTHYVGIKSHGLNISSISWGL